MITRLVIKACRVNKEVSSLGRNCLTRWVVSLDGGIRYRVNVEVMLMLKGVTAFLLPNTRAQVDPGPAARESIFLINVY